MFVDLAANFGSKPKFSHLSGNAERLRSLHRRVLILFISAPAVVLLLFPAKQRRAFIYSLALCGSPAKTKTKGTMITKEITLCSKQVTLAYCYATEIAYKDLSDEDMFDYAQAAVEAIQAQRDPDIKKTILAIIACMMAYYEDADKAPVKDSEIMKQATPVEIGTAMLTILSMRSEFYHVPSGEPEDKPEKGGKKRKNA